MSLFNSKSQSEKAQDDEAKTKAILDKRGLDLDAYSIGDIRKLNAQNLKNIANDIKGNKWFKAGMALSFAKGEEQAKVTYLSALVEQNWILIRQNEVIMRLLANNKK